MYILFVHTYNMYMIHGALARTRKFTVGKVEYLLASTEINDGPRFTHRGVLIDTSRHFISKKVIKENLDLMEMNKYNGGWRTLRQTQVRLVTFSVPLASH